MVGGAAWLEIYQSNTKSIFIDNSSADIHSDYSPATCATPGYESLSDFATRKNISNYTSITINGLSAIQYTMSGQRKATSIQNSNKKVVTVSAEVDSSNSDAYDIIINSVSFN